jgi:hypothetical protein
MPGAAVTHISTAVWAPPGFLQWHEVALQWPKCTQCTARHQQQAQQCVQGTYCGGWRRCACLDAKTRVLAVRALARTTCYNFIADLLFLSEVSHPLLVAGPPCVRPYLLFGEMGNRPSALLRSRGRGRYGAAAGPLRRSGAAAAQHPLLGLACGAKGRKQSKRIGD